MRGWPQADVTTVRSVIGIVFPFVVCPVSASVCLLSVTLVFPTQTDNFTAVYCHHIAASHLFRLWRKRRENIPNATVFRGVIIYKELWKIAIFDIMQDYFYTKFSTFIRHISQVSLILLNW